jgi:hypothetical protein
MAQDNKTIFNAEEEKKIQEAVNASKEQQRQDLIDAEIRNRILDAQSQQPGYRYS